MVAKLAWSDAANESQQRETLFILSFLPFQNVYAEKISPFCFILLLLLIAQGILLKANSYKNAHIFEYSFTLSLQKCAELP